MSEFLNNDNKLNCESCGAENKTGNTFCMNCGERISKVTENTIEPTDKTPVYEKADAEVVSSTPWHGEGNSSSQNTGGNPYQNTGSSYQAPPTYTTNTNANSGSSTLAIISLVCGIVSFFCCYFSFFISIAGVVTGIIALVKKQNGRGLAIAGIVISGLSILFYIIVFGVVALFSYDLFNTGYNLFEYF